MTSNSWLTVPLAPHSARMEQWPCGRRRPLFAGCQSKRRLDNLRRLHGCYWLVITAKVFRKCRRGYGTWCLALHVKMGTQVEFRIRLDHQLRKRRCLNLKEPPEVTSGEFLAGLGIHFIGRCDVHYDCTLDILGMVHDHARTVDRFDPTGMP
jgi:hypothetical protein